MHYSLLVPVNIENSEKMSHEELETKISHKIDEILSPYYMPCDGNSSPNFKETKMDGYHGGGRYGEPLVVPGDAETFIDPANIEFDNLIKLACNKVREDMSLENKDIPPTEHNENTFKQAYIARKSDIDLNAIKDIYNEDLITCAMIVDGKWYENEDFNDITPWVNQFHDLYNKIPDDNFIAILDCHC